MVKQYLQSDRNFDDLAPKFKKKVYGNLKGKIRLAVLKKDFEEYYPEILRTAKDTPLHILDAGCGYGPFSLTLARLGHRVTLCDHSERMLEIAAQTIDKENLSMQTTLVHSSIQHFTRDTDRLYDMVLCHAVLEWVTDPRSLIRILLTHLKPGGILSLTFYNLHGMVYKNLLRTNYKKIVRKEYHGWPGSLTPANPLTADQVLSWIEPYPLTVLCHSGIRVFHDYILDPKDRTRHPDTVLALELEFSRQPPYRDLGRYQHILMKKHSVLHDQPSEKDTAGQGSNRC
ncbi:MAG: methyltransferase domain-containing protein [Desulfobacterales bacterium]|nr:methyltransferase domain-containing protein [Desulfobacterales bacterium]